MQSCFPDGHYSCVDMLKIVLFRSGIDRSVDTVTKDIQHKLQNLLWGLDIH